MKQCNSANYWTNYEILTNPNPYYMHRILYTPIFSFTQIIPINQF